MLMVFMVFILFRVILYRLKIVNNVHLITYNSYQNYMSVFKFFIC